MMPFFARLRLHGRTAALVLALWGWHGLVPSAYAGDAPAGRISVTSAGQGPDVVFIPGLGSSADVWRVQVEALKPTHRVHAVQVRGFAGTPAGANAQPPLLGPIRDEILAHVRRAGLQRPALVGHSMGGLLALMIAERDGAAVGRVVIVDSLPFFPLLFDPNATVEGSARMAASIRDRILAQGQAAYAAGQPETMALLIKSKGSAAAAVLAASQASDHRLVAHALYEIWQTDMRPHLPAIRNRVLVLYPFDVTMGLAPGSVDALYQDAYAPLPDTSVVRVDGSYHFIQVDQPERLTMEMQRFLSAQ